MTSLPCHHLLDVVSLSRSDVVWLRHAGTCLSGERLLLSAPWGDRKPHLPRGTGIDTVTITSTWCALRCCCFALIADVVHDDDDGDFHVDKVKMMISVRRKLNLQVVVVSHAYENHGNVESWSEDIVVYYLPLPLVANTVELVVPLSMI